jgi:hypothetical protein
MMYGVTTNARAAPIYDAAVTSPTCSQHEPHNHLSQQLAALFAWNEGADTLHGVCLALLRVSYCFTSCRRCARKQATRIVGLPKLNGSQEARGGQ